MKKIVVYCIFVALTMITFSTSAVILSSKSYDASIVNGNYNMTILTNPKEYYFFNQPTAIGYSESILFVADNYGDTTKVIGFDVTHFGDSNVTTTVNFEIPYIITKIMVIDETILMLDVDGKFHSYNITSAEHISIDQDEVFDFDIFGGKIFVLYFSNVIKSFDSVSNLTSNDVGESFAISGKQNVTKIAFVSIATPIANSNFYIFYRQAADKYKIDEYRGNGYEEITTEPITTNIKSLQYVNSKLYYAVGNRLVNYTDGTENDSSYYSIVTKENNIYSINYYYDDSYPLQTLNFNGLEVKDTMLKSKSSDEWFYDKPTNITSRHNQIYIADSNNKRTVTINGTYSKYDIESSPISVAVDVYQNSYYLIDKGNTIAVLSKDGEYSLLLKNINTQTDDKDSFIGIVIDATDNLYGYTNNGIYLIGDGVISKTGYQDASNIVDVYTNYDKTGLYILNTSNEVKKYVDGSLTLINALGSDTISIAVDYSENVFALNNTGIIRKYTFGAQDADIELDLGIKSTKVDLSISMAHFTNEYAQTVSIGDLLLLDNLSSSVGIVLKNDIGIELLIDYDDPDKDEWIGINQDKYDDQIIYEAINDTAIYQFPMEASRLKTINQGATVIMLVYKLSAQNNITPTNYAFVMIDSIGENGQLVTGYIKKNHFSNANYAYINPSYGTVANVKSRDGYLYQYPSLYATKLSVDSNGNAIPLQQNQQVTILAFADYNRPGPKWRRVETQDGLRGYVLSDNLDSEFFSDNMELKIPNATINLYDIDGVTPLNRTTKDALSGQTPLTNGTRITLTGWFNPLSHYTTIQYTNENGTLITAVIESQYIKSDSISTLQVTALTLVVFLIPVFTIIVILYYRRCKARRTIIPEIVTISGEDCINDIEQILSNNFEHAGANIIM